MKRIPVLFFLCLILLFCLLPFAPSKSAAPGRVQGTAETFASLISKAESEGPVRVIVGLNTAFVAEGLLSNAQLVESQREVIAQAQDSLLGQLTAFDVGSITRFTFIPFIAMEVDAAGLAFLQNSPEVSSIEEDLPIPMALAESVPLIGGNAAWANGFTGAGQTVAILDSGVDKTHSFLTGKVVSEACYSTTDTNFLSVCPGGVSESTSPGSGVNCSVSLNQDCKHGTHVAGIAAGKGTSSSGVAKDANIISIQVFSQPRAGGRLNAYIANLVSGLERVHQLRGSFNIAAVNMSLGGGGSSTHCDTLAPSMTAAINNLRSINIATVISSGNDMSATDISFPACISSAISTGSTDDGSDGTTANVVSFFSNSASILNLLAPGSSITSSVPGNSFETFIGTSMAAPHVAGAWAVLKSKNPSASVDQVLQALTSTGLPIMDGRNGLTKPRITVDAALNALPSPPVPRTLTIASSNPGSGVSITVSPIDNSGFGNGVTQFSRTYSNGTKVSLTAPAIAGGNTFRKWQRNGVDWSFNQVTKVTMDANYTMTAVYVVAPTSGLQGYWKFDENMGTTTTDASGNGHTGTLTSGAAWGAGLAGAGVSLDGVNDYVQVGAQSSLVMTSAASFTAWIHPTGAGSNAVNGGSIISKEGEYVINRFANGSIRWGFTNSNPGWQFIDTGYVAPLNQWTHIAVTYDSGTIKTYANGSLVHTFNGSGSLADASTGQNDFRIGGRQVSPQHFQGQIDEVRVYNRALTANEVELIGDLNSGLQGYWKFDENMGTTAIDASGRGHSGTLTSGATWGAGLAGAGVSLDGLNDYVQVGAASSLVMTSAASFTAWIHPTGAGSHAVNGGTIISREGEYVINRFANGSIRWGFTNSNPGWQFIDTGYVAPLNQWTHIAVTYANGTIKTYANGSLVHTFNGSGSLADASTGQNDFRIGGRQVSPQHFQGQIDEVRVYNRALTANEITEFMGDLNSGLQGHWKFDENIGTTTTDASGNGHTGTLTSGAAWGAGLAGAGVNLDGLNDYVQVGAQSLLVITSAASFTAWIHPTGAGSHAVNGGTIISREGEYVINRFANGSIRWGFTNSNPGWQFIDTGYVAPLNQWTHIAVTYDNGTIKTYANGSLVHTFNGSGSLADASTGQNDFRIGGRQVSPQHFQGLIDEVRVYNRALTASEVELISDP